MPEPTTFGSDFAPRLQREVDRILADPAFQRAPVQSRLLGYLLEQTIARNCTISQRAVAVDGLGRPGRIGRPAESYPRVQISRLRRNLALHYARCPPGEGLAVYIRRGDYQLRLATPDSVYGEPRPRPVRPASTNDGAAAALARRPSAATGPWKWPLRLAAALLGVVALAGLWLLLRP